MAIDQPRTDSESQTSTPSNPSNDQDSTEMLVQIFLEAARKLWFRIKQASSFLMVELGGYQAFHKVFKWCVRNPHLAICMIAGVFVMLLPFLILMGFAISTIVVTFAGFLVLEGTLLTIVSMLLFGCLAALAIVMIFFTVVVVAAYFGFVHIYDLYGGVEHNKTALQEFLNNEHFWDKPENSKTGTGNSTDRNRNPNEKI